MDASALKEMQAPFKQRYRDEPEAAIITLKAAGEIGEGVSCTVATGKALVEAGLHPATGGSGLQACSGDMLLEALVACAGVTLNAVATALAIPLRAGKVYAEGDLDFRGTLGVAKDAPVGFTAIRLRFELDSDAAGGPARDAPEAHRALLRGLPDPAPGPGRRGAPDGQVSSSGPRQSPSVQSRRSAPCHGLRASTVYSWGQTWPEHVKGLIVCTHICTLSHERV